MRVALVSWGYLEYVIQLASSLSKKEEVMLFMPERFRPFIEKNRPKSLEVSYFERPRLRNPKNLVVQAKLVEKIKEFRPDVIHLQDGDIWFSFLMHKLRGYKIVITLHDPKQHLGEEKVWETLRDRINKHYASSYIVHGRYLKHLLSDHVGVDEKKIFVAEHGNFNMMVGSKSKKLDKKNRILFFGRIWPYKGLDVLIKAEPLITGRIPGLKIIIAGKGEDISKYEELIRDKDKYEIHNRYIENKELPDFFNRSDLVVLPYKEATQSGVVCMAYSFSKPVVATRVGSLPEIIDEGKTGLLVPPDDPKALADAVVRLLSDRKKLASMSKYAFEKSKKDLDWDKIADKTIGIYKNA